ncbi:MAG TPA: ferritin-like domain-containing protein [Clostridia bacterium]|nr:ferritin-like domain-containing protein [Clostridia bacterium]
MDEKSKLSSNELILAMTGKQNTITFYQQLVTMTQDRRNRDLICTIRNDEISHFKSFMDLYRKLFNKSPVLPPVKRVVLHSFEEGLNSAVIDELDASNFYRDLYLNNCNPFIKKIFFKSFTDETSHAIKNNYMLAKFYKNRP